MIEPRARVLIIDDDELISVALLGQLGDAGISTDVAVDPEQARTLLESRTYAVVVIDPYMTGQLHKRAAALLDTVLQLHGQARVILVSAYGSEQLAARARQCHALTIVTKPVYIRDLAELVEGLLTVSRELNK